MTFTAHASSSAGNFYTLAVGDRTLGIECGISFREIQQLLKFRVTGLDGVLLSHEHGDHARSARELVRAGVDVYASQGTLNTLGLEGHRARPLRAMEQIRVGPWTVLPFDAVHDAQEPLGFLISAGAEKLLYLTDSAYCRYRFSGLAIVAVEANYSAQALRQGVLDGDVHPAHKRRVLENHMSIERALDLLRANDLSRVRQVWLLHLSDQNSDEEAFRAQVAALTGKPVYVAARDAGHGAKEVVSA